MGTAKGWLKKIVGRRGATRAENEKTNSTSAERHSLWNFRRSSGVSEKGSPQNGHHDEEPRGNGPIISSNMMDATNFMNSAVHEERAAIVIQTAFRGFLARRALRALKGLVRLQASINRNGVHKQSIGSLRCIQAYVKVQARIRAHRVLKNGEGATPKHSTITNEPQYAESEPGWDDSIGTVEETQAKVQQRHEAAIKRERALAYAFSNQWRANTKMTSDTLFDYDLEKSTWSWIWLDRWMSGQYGENCSWSWSSKNHDGLEKATSKDTTVDKKSTNIQRMQKARTSPVHSHRSLEQARSQGALNSLEDTGKRGVPTWKNECRLWCSPQHGPLKDAHRRNSLPNIPVKKPSTIQATCANAATEKARAEGAKEELQSTST